MNSVEEMSRSDGESFSSQAKETKLFLCNACILHQGLHKHEPSPIAKLFNAACTQRAKTPIGLERMSMCHHQSSKDEDYRSSFENPLGSHLAYYGLFGNEVTGATIVQIFHENVTKCSMPGLHLKSV